MLNCFLFNVWQVEAILVNIFGGIVNCAIIANGITKACRELELKVPLVVRLEGKNINTLTHYQCLYTDPKPDLIGLNFTAQHFLFFLDVLGFALYFSFCMHNSYADQDSTNLVWTEFVSASLVVFHYGSVRAAEFPTCHILPPLAPMYNRREDTDWITFHLFMLIKSVQVSLWDGSSDSQSMSLSLLTFLLVN